VRVACAGVEEVAVDRGDDRLGTHLACARTRHPRRRSRRFDTGRRVEACVRSGARGQGARARRCRELMPAGLLDRTTRFIGALREAGMPVSLAESIDAARALTAVPLIDREALRAGLAATTCKRPAYRHTFDALFDLWFPPAMGTAESESAYAGEDSSDAAPIPAGDPDLARDLLRKALERLLV